VTPHSRAPFTIASYNIHKARGLDRRVDLMRIAAVLEEIGAGAALLCAGAAVKLGGPMKNDAVNRHPRAGTDEDGVTGADVGDRGFDLDAVKQDDGAGHLQRGQFLGRRAGDGAGAVVEVTAEEEEEGKKA